MGRSDEKSVILKFYNDEVFKFYGGCIGRRNLNSVIGG